MATNIELIKILRERTGAGIMDCKNALAATGDDVDKASDWLREKGIAKQAKKADRIAAEGLVTIAQNGLKAVLVEVNCETDFVANSDPFKELVAKIADTVLNGNFPSFESANEAVAPLFTDATVKLGEKLTFRRFEVVEAAEGHSLTGYIHGKGKIGVLVDVEKADEELGKGIAMTVAAYSPKYKSYADIPSDVIEAEKKVQLEACKNDEKLKNKPEQALVKIVEGKVNKYFSESVLEQIGYIYEPEKTVGQVLKEKGNNVTRFVRFQTGEGIEKRVDNFAEEVAKQAGN